MRKLLLAGLVTAIALVASCATIMHGTSQNIGISSSPTSAKVNVDGTDLGVTPIITHMSRKDNHIVTLKLDGYQPAQATLTRGVSGWVWGNVLFGGLIGLAVDAISGGLYKLSPEQVAADLKQNPQAVRKVDGLIYVSVVLQPDPSWQKVGQLSRAQ